MYGKELRANRPLLPTMAILTSQNLLVRIVVAKEQQQWFGGFSRSSQNGKWSIASWKPSHVTPDMERAELATSGATTFPHGCQ